MPQWAIVAAVLGVLGYIAFRKPVDTAPATPKNRFDEGKAAGFAAGKADAVAKIPSRVKATREDVDRILRTPDAWMYDPTQSYNLGYNIGYLDGYGTAVKPVPAPAPAGDGLGGLGGGFGGSDLKMGLPPPPSPSVSPAISPTMFTSVAPSAFITMAPSDPFAALPDDLRAEVDAAYASGDPQQLDDVAIKLIGVPYAAAWKKVKDDAAKLRERQSIGFLDLPLGAGSVFAEIESSGEAVLPSGDPSSWGATVEWVTIKPVADALWNRGYKTAANQLARQWANFKSKRGGAPESAYNAAIADKDYPLVSGTVAGRFSTRISSEWQGQVPHWYAHPSFRRMR